MAAEEIRGLRRLTNSGFCPTKVVLTRLTMGMSKVLAVKKIWGDRKGRVRKTMADMNRFILLDIVGSNAVCPADWEARSWRRGPERSMPHTSPARLPSLVKHTNNILFFRRDE